MIPSPRRLHTLFSRCRIRRHSTAVTWAWHNQVVTRDASFWARRSDSDMTRPARRDAARDPVFEPGCARNSMLHCSRLRPGRDGTRKACPPSTPGPRLPGMRPGRRQPGRWAESPSAHRFRVPRRRQHQQSVTHPETGGPVR